MAFALENIGFPIKELYRFLDLHFQVVEHGKVISTPAGPYLWFAPGAGVELWAKIEDEGKLGHIHPHFAGRTRIRVALVEKHAYENNALAEGRFIAYFKHKEGEGIESVHERLRYGDGTYTGVIPFVFDAPDYNCYADLQMPVATDVQITAFPLEMTAYETEDDWVDAQLEADRRALGPGEEMDEDPGFMAGASFIPTTMLFEKRSPDDYPKPTAQLSGIVLEAAIITNPVTEQDFSWARIETAAGEMDLVVSLDLIEGYLVEGGVVAGHCYLSGRLPEFAPQVE
jgi:hypothetical protein